MCAMTKMTTLLQSYEGNRVIRGLIQLIPFGIGSAVDVVLTQTIEKMRQERARVFFDELAKDNVIDGAELLQSEDFIHCYISTIRVALNARRKEKIRMFARLLKSSLNTFGPTDVDEYEDFLKILDELSYREIRALYILDNFSQRPRDGGDNELQWTNTFWEKFENRVCGQLNIQREAVADLMNRTARTGCYEVYTGAYLDYTGGKGKLTPTFRRLKEFIRTSEADG